MEILWNLQDLSSGESNRYTVQCCHPGLASSLYSDTLNIPILTSQSLIPTPITGFILEQGGPTLSQFLLSTSTVLPTRIQILKEIVEALRFLHSHEIVHLNINPDNIVLSSGAKNSCWKLTDFSNSCVSGKTIDMRSMTSLDLEYCAPELIRMSDHSALMDISKPSLAISQLDIWSLGMVAVFLLSGSSARKLLFPDSQDFHTLLKMWDGGDNEEKTLEMLSLFFEENEGRNFIEQCLKFRSSCEELLVARIFSVL